MKKALAIILIVVLLLTCLSSCVLFAKDKDISLKEYENCAVFTLDYFEGSYSVILRRTGLGEGAIYYQVNLEHGFLTVNYDDAGFIHEEQTLGKFTADDEMPINGSGGYIEGEEIEILFGTLSPVKGEIIIAFTEDALKAVHGNLHRHEHEYYYETKTDAHKMVYTCDCTNLEERDFEPHYDENGDGNCDECEYYVGKAHKYHDYYFEMNEDSHMQVFTCTCVSEGFEPHYNSDCDEFCDECGWNMVGHIHTFEKYQDEIGHGWSYTCGCMTPPNFAQHFDGDTDGKCDDCEYTIGTPDIMENRIIYEKERSDSYSVIGFQGDALGIVEIPDTYNGLPVRYIRGNAFYGQEGITELIIGNNVYSIEGNAFMRCSNLKKVTLGKSVEIIDMQAFLGCSELKEITIPSSVSFIGNGAFEMCDRLEFVILEDPNGWCTSDDVYNIPFSVVDMSNPETVAEYFTDTYVRVSWIKED